MKLGRPKDSSSTYILSRAAEISQLFIYTKEIFVLLCQVCFPSFLRYV